MDLIINNLWYIVIIIGTITIAKFIIPKRKVKGNISVNGAKIYYTEDHRLYSSVQAEKLFRSVRAAQKAGYRAPKR